MVTIEMVTEDDFEHINALDRMILGNFSRRNFLVNAIKAGQCLIVRIGNVRGAFVVWEQSLYLQERGFYHGRGYHAAK